MGILAFNKSRKQFNELLSGSRLTNHRYVRLMCLAGFGSFATVTLGTLTLIRNINRGIIPWNGWADTHADFSRVDEVPAIFWRSSPEVEASMELSRWLNVICAFTFFGFFGFAEEARKNYRCIAKFLAKHIAIPSIASFTSSFFNPSGYVRTLTSQPSSHLTILF
jgi:pheromone a factor receptor